MNNKIDNQFVQTRHAGVGLAVILITLASGMMAWVYEARFLLPTIAKVFFYISIGLMGCTIFCALFMLLFIYKGYLNHVEVNYVGVIVAQSNRQKKSNKYFRWADWAVNVAFGAFTIGVISSVIFWLLDSKSLA